MEVEHSLSHFLVTVIAVLLGLIVAKYIAVFLSGAGIPIAAGDPKPKTLPGQPVLPWRTA